MSLHLVRALIPGAQVTVTTSAGNAAGSTKADASGAYEVRGLAPGGYIVNVSYEGFAPFQSQIIALASGQVKRVDVAVYEKGDRPGGSMLLSSCVVWRYPDLDTFRAECPEGDAAFVAVGSAVGEIRPIFLAVDAFVDRVGHIHDMHLGVFVRLRVASSEYAAEGLDALAHA